MKNNKKKTKTKAKSSKNSYKISTKKLSNPNTNLNNKNSVPVTPLLDRVVLKPLTEDEVAKTPSGIIIPDTVSKEKPEQGIVVAVGEGRWEDGKRVPVSIKVGDKVVFSRYGYDEVKINGVEYYVLKEENILAIIR